MRGPMKHMLKIHQVGQPILRQKSAPLTPRQIRSRETRELIEMMRETLLDAPGVGLAAPQVGVGLQLVVIEDREQYQQDLTSEQLAERQRQPVPFHVLINPELSVADPHRQWFFEGCLSVSGYTAVTPRATAVRVRALNEKGAPIDIDAGGWYARILQHEVDHLNGRLYVDHMMTGTFMTTVNYQRLWSRHAVGEVCAALGCPLEGG